MLNLTTYLDDKGLVVFGKNFDPEVTTKDETTTLSVGPSLKNLYKILLNVWFMLSKTVNSNIPLVN